MQLIVLDMEWNQAYPGSRAAIKYPDLHGEIIQIGAVKLNPDFTPGDEFQKLVYPSFMPHLSKRVAKLTGITEDSLHENGLPFPLIIQAFLKWCGEDFALLTWGYDDIPILRENLKEHRLKDDWTDKWFNLQLIFNAQTDGSSTQKALSTAMDFYGIEASRPAHDALGDAYHTALLCSKLDMTKGIAEYGKARKKAENDTGNIPGCLQRSVFHCYESKDAALKGLMGEYNLCPKCGTRMKARTWFSQPGRRYMNMMTCPRHGEFMVRLRMTSAEDGGLKVVRLVYAGDSEAAASYRAREDVYITAKAQAAPKTKTPKTGTKATSPSARKEENKRFRFFRFARWRKKKPKEQ